MVNDSTTANQLIQDQISPMLIEPLEAASVVLAAGPTIFNSSEPLRIKKMTSGFTPHLVGENEEIPDGGQAAFDEIELMPTDRKSIKVIIRISNELIRMAKDGVSATLQARLVQDVRNALDDALLAGDGTDNGITGLLNQPELTTAPLDLADPDTFLDALALLASREVTAGKVLMNGTDFFQLRKLKDSNGRHLLQSDLSGEATYRLHGVPVTVTNKLPQGKAVLGDMKSVAVVRDTDPQVKLLDQRYAEFDQVGIRVTTRYDLGLIRPEGLLILDGTPDPVV